MKSFETQLNVYREVVEYGAILDDPKTASAHIRRAISCALKFLRPVYLEVPRDMVFSEIECSVSFEDVALKVSEVGLDESSQKILQRLQESQRPVLVVGVEAHRLKLQDRILRLAERLKIPVASSFLGRGTFPIRHEQFIGTYLGTVSPEPLRQIVENSDCLIMLGVMMTDTSLGIPPDSINPAKTILCVSRSVTIKGRSYQDVPLDLLVDRLIESSELGSKECSLLEWKMSLSPEVLEPFRPDESIRVNHLIHILNDFLALHPEMPVVSDIGDCLFAAVDIRSNQCIAPAFYATMGFAIPGAIGVQITSGQRPLVLVGDGAFQMTGCEISQSVKYRLNPIVILFNNSRWEMLQSFFPHAQYNETVEWPFAKMAELWGGRGYEVRTPGEFQATLVSAWEESCFTLIDVHLEKGDISPILRGFVKGLKGKVYP